MEILGKIESVTSDGRYIICCDNLPEIGDVVFNDGMKIGKVGRIFGPVDTPYVSVTPSDSPSVQRGSITFFKGRKRDAKGKRRS